MKVELIDRETVYEILQKEATTADFNFRWMNSEYDRGRRDALEQAIRRIAFCRVFEVREISVDEEEDQEGE